MRASIKEFLLKNKHTAEQELLLLRTAREKNRRFLEEHLHRYILSKYFLEGSDTGSTDINELTRISLAKSQKIDKGLVEEYDIAAGCSGATSAIAKKTLLYMAIQRELNITISASDITGAKNVSQLADLVWEAMAD